MLQASQAEFELQVLQNWGQTLHSCVAESTKYPSMQAAAPFESQLRALVGSAQA